MRLRGLRRGLLAAAVMLALPAVDAGVHHVAEQLGAKQQQGDESREAWGGALGAAVLTGAWGVARVWATRQAAADAAGVVDGAGGAGLDVVPVERSAPLGVTATAGPGF